MSHTAPHQDEVEGPEDGPGNNSTASTTLVPPEDEVDDQCTWQDLVDGVAVQYSPLTKTWTTTTKEVEAARTALATQKGLVRLYEFHRANWASALIRYQADRYDLNSMVGKPQGPRTLVKARGFRNSAEDYRQHVEEFTELIAEARRMARYIKSFLDRYDALPSATGGDDESGDDSGGESEHEERAEVLRERRVGKRRRHDSEEDDQSESESEYGSESDRNVRPRRSRSRSVEL